MVEFCVWRRYLGPMCYEVTEQEKTNMDILAVLTSVAIITLIIAIILCSKKTGAEKQFLIVFSVITFILFVWTAVYQSRVTVRAELICSGARECSGRGKRQKL
jgi:hypothetical protein